MLLLRLRLLRYGSSEAIKQPDAILPHGQLRMHDTDWAIGGCGTPSGPKGESLAGDMVGWYLSPSCMAVRGLANFRYLPDHSFALNAHPTFLALLLDNLARRFRAFTCHSRSARGSSLSSFVVLLIASSQLHHACKEFTC